MKKNRTKAEKPEENTEIMIQQEEEISALSSQVELNDEEGFEDVAQIVFEGLNRLKSSVFGGYNKESVLDIVDSIIEQSENQLADMKRYVKAKEENCEIIRRENAILREKIIGLMCRIKEDQEDFALRIEMKDAQIDLLRKENQQMNLRIINEKKAYMKGAQRQIGVPSLFENPEEDSLEKMMLRLMKSEVATEDKPLFKPESEVSRRAEVAAETAFAQRAEAVRQAELEAARKAEFEAAWKAEFEAEAARRAAVSQKAKVAAEVDVARKVTAAAEVQAGRKAQVGRKAEFAADVDVETAATQKAELETAALVGDSSEVEGLPLRQAGDRMAEEEVEGFRSWVAEQMDAYAAGWERIGKSVVKTVHGTMTKISGKRTETSAETKKSEHLADGGDKDWDLDKTLEEFGE